MHQQESGQTENYQHKDCQQGGSQENLSQTSQLFSNFVALIALLRSEQGCPWDREQTHQSIAKNMIEEAYEAVEAIEGGSPSQLKDELGDVLLQVVLHAQMAFEAEEFTLDDVIEGISKKLISRHPHVFGNEASFAAAGFTPEEIALVEEATDAEATLKLWDRMKQLEKQRKAAALGTPGASGAPGSTDAWSEQNSLLANIPKSEPALMQAQNISRKAVGMGFEWEDIEGLTDKLAEEFEEFARAEAGSKEAEEEFGDILFTLVNVARWNGIDAEGALRRSCEKFRTRWTAMEQIAEQEGFDLRELDYKAWDDLWNEVK
ncbi:MAG: nucleoside triphosphate pyrophosphohydrolase [Coriobacteriia bacterium]|nr:nucleoside triphosphate pyrophosphohydrolase [Coriobacteriia bacterium]MCL2749571.1 nucleoside triphosphate pyrophosphohydrolase [Coriobacteriia bacterium]